MRARFVMLVLLALAGCGGGGGGTPAPRAMLPLLISDEAPAGERIDVRSSQHFPAAAGDQWTYARWVGATAAGSVTRQASPGPAPDTVRVDESGDVASSSAIYRRTADGLVLVDAVAGALPPTAAAIVGDILEYAEPFHAIGATRRVVRQGGLGLDFDGDGLEDSFRLEYTQVFLGFEQLALPRDGRAEAARFRNVTTVTLQPSKAERPLEVVVGTEEAWWAPGIGLVRAERAVTDGRGNALEPAYRLDITGGHVGNRALFAPPPDGTVIDLALPHRALVYDALRTRYYASVPGSVVGDGNRIAVIDPADGRVSYSPPVGSDPGALAVAADGSALYVGLNGSGDVIKLRLPDFAELQRTRLPADPFFGPLFAENITVSPLDPDLVAVSMFRSGVSPRHGGVALLRAGVLQPRRTRDHTGSNLVAFGSDGQSVFGFNNESTEFGLRRLAVLTDGLEEVAVVPSIGAGFDTRSLDAGPTRLVIGTALYRPADLSLLGNTGTQGGCRSAGAKLVCRYDPNLLGNEGRLAVVDAETGVIESTPVYQTTPPGSAVDQIVVGPRGQVALRRGGGFTLSPSTTITLFSAAALP